MNSGAPSFSPGTHPTTYQFSVMWNNNETFTRPMSNHIVTLRDGGGHHNIGGITAKSLHLDQVHVIFRPSDQITQFMNGDDATKNWRVETSQLLVRTNPGNQNILYNTDADPLTSSSVVRDPVRCLMYSSALALVPDTDGPEDYWCRTYRPVRDLPIAHYLTNVSELSIDLLFPLLFSDKTAPSTFVPNYRILKVLCEFSVNQ